VSVNKTVYLSLGGNLGDREGTLQQALAKIAQIPDVKDLEVSQSYETSPISDIPQSDFINLVCSLRTTLSAFELLSYLQKIETKLGKTPKPKDAPRTIDIDILFFGTDLHEKNKQNDHIDLEIPHPRWKQRLFVIVPLLDLTKAVTVPANLDGKRGEEIIDLIKLRDSLLNEKSQHVRQYNS